MRASLTGLLLLPLVACSSGAGTPKPPPPAADRGAALFTQHCAICHGIDGEADAAVADLLLPRPAPFSRGLFKLVSTTNGVPTDADLVDTLRRGMPGSTMMSFGWLPDTDLAALAAHVRELAVAGRAATLQRTAALAGTRLDAAAATAQARAQFTPGAVVEPIPLLDPSPETLAEGEQLYLQHCAACHGKDGRGLPATAGWPTDGSWLWPRDFTSGYLRGEPSPRALANRLLAGMPGAHMPPTALSPAEAGALVAWVRSMIPDAAGDRHAQWRRTIRVARSQTVPASDDAPAFAAIEAVRLPLAPLHWRAAAPNEVWLRAAHDGRELVLQLDWADPTRDDRIGLGARNGDGAAVQWSRDQEPPLFAMGSAEQPVNIWRWRSYDPKEAAGLADLLVRQPHQGLDVGFGSLQPPPRRESIEVHGMGTIRSQTGSGQPLAVTTRWNDGRWTVTFRRSLAARDRHEVDLSMQGPVLFALAIWDGSIDLHAGSKSITTWHVLDLQR